MTPKQNEWMAGHPEHQVQHGLGAVSIYTWADAGFLTPDGHLLPDGKPFCGNVYSNGDTLIIVPKGSISVGPKGHASVMRRLAFQPLTLKFSAF